MSDRSSASADDDTARRANRPPDGPQTFAIAATAVAGVGQGSVCARNRVRPILDQHPVAQPIYTCTPREKQWTIAHGDSAVTHTQHDSRPTPQPTRSSIAHHLQEGPSGGREHREHRPGCGAPPPPHTHTHNTHTFSRTCHTHTRAPNVTSHARPLSAVKTARRSSLPRTTESHNEQQRSGEAASAVGAAPALASGNRRRNQRRQSAALLAASRMSALVYAGADA